MRNNTENDGVRHTEPTMQMDEPPVKTADGNGWKRLFRVTGFFGGVQAVAMVASLVRNKCAALWLGPSGMGMVSLLTSLTSMLTQAAGMGLSMSAVRQLSLAFARDRLSWLRMVSCVRLLEAVGCVLTLLLCGVFGQWLLSLAVMAAVAMGGEMAVLKAAGLLRQLAAVQLIAVVICLAVTVPLYWLYGARAIVPVIVLSAWGALVPVAWCSLRLCPLSWVQGDEVRREAHGMLRLSVAFSAASLLGAATEYVVRWWLGRHGDMAVVGLFAMGQMLTAGLMSMLFAALEQDYLPRLSATTDSRLASRMICRQMMVVGGLSLPLMALVVVLSPWLIPLLLSSDFLPMVPLIQWFGVSMVLKAATMPVAYLTLARGRSLHFLLLELSYDLVFLAALAVGFAHGGLVGMGVGIAAAHMFDLVLIHGYARLTLGFRYLWRGQERLRA